VKRAVPFAVLAPGGQSGNFWIHARIRNLPMPDSLCYTWLRLFASTNSG